jgi:hypothetical protein
MILIQQAVMKTLDSLKFIRMENEMLDVRDSGYKIPPPPERKPIPAVRIDESNIDQMP